MRSSIGSQIYKIRSPKTFGVRQACSLMLRASFSCPDGVLRAFGYVFFVFCWGGGYSTVHSNGLSWRLLISNFRHAKQCCWTWFAQCVSAPTVLNTSLRSSTSHYVTPLHSTSPLYRSGQSCPTPPCLFHGFALVCLKICILRNK